MKKFILILFLIFFGVQLFGQDDLTVYEIDTFRSQFGRTTDNYSLWVTQDSNYIYFVTKRYSPLNTLSRAFGQGYAFKIQTSSLTSILDTGYVKTYGTEALYANYTASGTWSYTNNVFIRGTGDLYLKALDNDAAPDSVLTVVSGKIKATSVAAYLNFWTQSGGKLYPTTSTDTVWAKSNMKIDGRLILDDGGNSVFIGTDAGLNDDGTDNYNVAIGRQALSTGTGAIYSVAVGTQALRYYNDVGWGNTSVGNTSLCGLTDGAYNTALGFNAGREPSITEADNSVFLGAGTCANADSETNQIVIGANAIGNGSNTATIGDDNVTAVYMAEDAGAKVYAGSAVLASGTTVNEFSIDGTLAGNSDDALPTEQAVKTYVDALVTAQDLDFAGDAGTGAVDLDSQTFTLAGTANEIETSAGSQTITIGLPNNVTISGILSLDNISGITTDGDIVIIPDGTGVISVVGTTNYENNVSFDDAIPNKKYLDDNFQPLDADLTALAALSTTGMMARTAANTYVMRTITGTADRLTVSNGDGVGGNPTLDVNTAYDIVTTAPITGGENNVLIGADGDLTIALTIDKDITASGLGMGGGQNDVLPGADSDVTITLTTDKDVVATAPLLVNSTTNVDDILPGADADLTFSIATDSIKWAESATVGLFPKNGEDVSLISSTTLKPDLTIRNNNVDATSGRIIFDKQGGSPLAGDNLGVIHGKGDDSGGALTDFATITFNSDNVTDGDEAGKITFRVMFDDGSPALEKAFVMSGDNGTPGEGEILINEDNQDFDFSIGSENISGAFLIDGETGQMTATDTTSAWGYDPAYGTRHMVYRSNIELEDEQAITFFSDVHGWGEISTDDGTTYAEFRFTTTGTVTLLSDCTGDVNDADVDTDLCIYDGGGTAIVIKNRLGHTYGLLINIHYGSTTFP